MKPSIHLPKNHDLKRKPKSSKFEKSSLSMAATVLHCSSVYKNDQVNLNSYPNLNALKNCNAFSNTFVMPKCFNSKLSKFPNSNLLISTPKNKRSLSKTNSKCKPIASLPNDSTSQISGDAINVLVIGGGGREHALCYALKNSPTCNTVFCAPGNAGISSSKDAICDPKLNVNEADAVAEFCKKNEIGLVVIGPEAPLVAGLVDKLTSGYSIPTFGPTAGASQLEGSKSFMKRICDTYSIPTAAYASFTDAQEAKDYILTQKVPVVVKADGLAAGKGVTVAQTVQEACEAVDSMLLDREFGSAGAKIVIEEFLVGEEASFFALVDGHHALALASAQDHKPVGDGDVGPNTGGMGAYSPAPVLTREMEDQVMEKIIRPTVRGMAEEGYPFTGVLYAGLMINPATNEPKLLEYNVRFGDPECQVLMMRLKSDLVQTLLSACQGRLSETKLEWSPEPALVVVMASQGYPGKYEKGSVIRGLDLAEASHPRTKIFHAGTAEDEEGNLIAVGGRVLGITAAGENVAIAQGRAYAAIDKVVWKEGFCRRDIGWRAVERLGVKSKI